MGAMPSPITGSAGNIEFLVHARTPSAPDAVPPGTGGGVDVPELLKILTFEGGTPEVFDGVLVSGGQERVYRTPAEEFELSRIAHRPRGRADQPEHNKKCQKEAYGARHLRHEQGVKHQHYSPFRFGSCEGPERGAKSPQRLTAPVTFAAAITNKGLKIVADFPRKADA